VSSHRLVTLIRAPVRATLPHEPRRRVCVCIYVYILKYVYSQKALTLISSSEHQFALYRPTNPAGVWVCVYIYIFYKKNLTEYVATRWYLAPEVLLCWCRYAKVFFLKKVLSTCTVTFDI
jgi:hypothetical protein